MDTKAVSGGEKCLVINIGLIWRGLFAIRCRHLVSRIAQRKAATHSLPQASRTRDPLFAQGGACSNNAPAAGPSSFAVVVGFAEISREVRDTAVLYLFGAIGALVPPTD